MGLSPVRGEVSLAMYPFEHLRGSYDRLWTSVRVHLGATRSGGDQWPEGLTWVDDVAGLWRSPEMLLAQTCGWPLITRLADRVRVIGAFAYDVDGAEGCRYRSVIVSRSAACDLDDLGEVTVAVNNPDSLSGWVSLRHRIAWFGPVLWTGSHRESVRAVAEGRAEVASIDAVSLAHVSVAEPTLVRELHVVGRGPAVHSLPLICRSDLSELELADLRLAIATASTDPMTKADRANLRIVGFCSLDLHDYLGLAELDPDLFQEQSG